MKVEFEKVPLFLRLALPLLVWRMPAQHDGVPTIYLTFDDGPNPKVTPKILEILQEFGAKATFFCLGSHAAEHPDLVHETVEQGHSIGNHGSRHLDGWKTATREYVDDAILGQNQIPVPTKLYRPPYGRFTFAQWWRLRSRFRCIMWDVTSMDYREDLNHKQVAQIVTKSSTPGSIILFHDSEGASDRVLDALPAVLEHFKDRHYQLASLDM